MKLRARIGALAAGLAGLSQISSAAALLVQLRDPGMASMVAANHRIVSYKRAGASPFFRFELPAGVSAAAYEPRLARDSRVLEAEEDKEFIVPENQSSRGTTIGAVYDSSVSYAANTSLWAQINLPPAPAWTGHTVAVIDTGLSDKQPALWLKVRASASFVANSPSPFDLPSGKDSNHNGFLDEGAGHGTMVAGLIAQISPRSNLVIARVADSDGVATSWSILQGVVFAAESKAGVINISLGSLSEVILFSDLVDWLEGYGVTVVAAAGNAAADKAMQPAGVSNVVCVPGLLPDNRKAPFSCWDSGADVSAPATGIRSAWWDGKTAIWSGTSFAAPIVAGAIAAGSSYGSRIDTDKVHKALKASNRSIDSLNPAFQGKLGGLLNAAALGVELRKP